METPPSSTLEQALTALAQMEQQAEAVRQAMEQEQVSANRIMRISLAFLACMALVNVQFIYLLTDEFRSVIHNMVSMYEHFGRVAERMNDMTAYVTDMEQNVRLMPVMGQQMAAMNGNMVSMAQDMRSMVSDIVDMQQRVGGMKQDMGLMSQQFHHLNANVGAMGVNVHQMSNTVP